MRILRDILVLVAFIAALDGAIIVVGVVGNATERWILQDNI